MRVVALRLETVSAPTGRPSFADVAATEIDHVYRFMLHFTRDPALADDLTSSTFERALREWHRYDPRRGRPRPWLLEIARRLALDHYRTEARRAAREQRAAEPEAHDGRIDAALGLPADLRAALGALSAPERELVALRVILDVDTAETAQILGISRTAVSTGLHRALARLRREMERGGT